MGNIYSFFNKLSFWLDWVYKQLKHLNFPNWWSFTRSYKMYSLYIIIITFRRNTEMCCSTVCANILLYRDVMWLLWCYIVYLKVVRNNKISGICTYVIYISKFNAFEWFFCVRSWYSLENLNLKQHKVIFILMTMIHNIVFLSAALPVNRSL